MSVYTVPFSSSPPSTPGSKPQKGRPSFATLANNPSTTPAGPPPSSAGSFTPAGPPPSSLFDSSQLRSAPTSSIPSKSAFGQKPAHRIFGNQSSLSSSSHAPLPRTKNGTPAKPTGGQLNTFQVPDSSPYQDSGFFRNSEQESMVEDGVAGDIYEDEEEDDMEVDGHVRSLRQDDTFAGVSRLGSFAAINRQAAPYNFNSSIPQQSPKSAKKARIEGHSRQAGAVSQKSKSPRRKKKDSAIPDIARDLASRSEPAPVNEPDDLILRTEKIIGHMYEKAQESKYQDAGVQTSIPEYSEELVKIWQSSAGTPSGPRANLGGIGPGDDASPLSKATFLATLLLQLHHPPTLKVAATPTARSIKSRSLSNLPSTKSRLTPTPKVLLDWLDTYHNQYSNVLHSLKSQPQNTTAYGSFWDVILALTLRGKISDVIHILRGADFNYARSALEDGGAQPGYRGPQLQNIHRVINRAIHLLEVCPGVQSGDWDIKDASWAVFRKKIEATLGELEDFAEGEDRAPDMVGKGFQAENFGVSGAQQATMSLSQSTRRAQSNVPWSIYQSLRLMYSILLGSTSEIISQAQDWLEATVGLTVWWNGDDDDEITRDSLGAGRRSMRHSQSQAPRSVDSNLEDAYLRRLDYAFSRVTDSADENAFQVNTLSPIEIGLASTFEGNVEGVLDTMKPWSLAITAAVAEIGSFFGWLETSAGAKAIQGFNDTDLMVLDYDQGEEKFSKDDILTIYAGGLYNRGILHNDQSRPDREGWELAVEVLNRLDDQVMGQQRIGELLSYLDLDTEERMDKIIMTCTDLGLDNQARAASERYADYLAENSESYGLALICYARAHAAKKIKNVVDLLISYCLVQSTAYPRKAELDKHLSYLIASPKESLSHVAASDPEAAGILQFHFSGYATLRRFYDLRDEEILLEKGKKQTLRSLARKRAAAEALVTVINSAGDSIYGGLYDESRSSAVQVDGLLALLGEALPFVDQPTSLLTTPQVFDLLTAIESLQTVPLSIYAQCEECFLSTIHNAHGSLPPSPRAMLKKSVSSMTSSGGFSLIGSEMLDEHPKTRSMGNSGVLVTGEIKRGWDWRKGLEKDARGADVLAMLRLGLAREVARGRLDA